jgi:flagellin
MGLFANTNVSSSKARRQVFTLGQTFNSFFKRLSSGFSIHCASDAAAVLNISNRLTTQIQGLHQSVQNTSLSGQNASGTIGDAITSSQRIRNLLVQFKNGINSSDVHNSLQKELQSLKKVSGHILSNTDFTNIDILRYHFSAKFLVDESSGQTISFDLSTKSDLDIIAADIAFAGSACVVFTEISEHVCMYEICPEMSALQNSFQFTTPYSRNISENVTGFRIRDKILGGKIAELERNQQACLLFLSREKQGLQSAFSIFS